MNLDLRGPDRKPFMPVPKDYLGPRSRERRQQHSKMTDEAWKERIVADATLSVEAPEGYVFNAKIQKELASIPPEGVAKARKENAPPPPIMERGAMAQPDHIFSNGIKWNLGKLLAEGYQGKVFEISHEGKEEKKRIVKILIADTENEKKNLWNEVGAAMASGDFVGTEVVTEKNSVWAAVIMERHEGVDGEDLYLQIDRNNPPVHDTKMTYKFSMALRGMVHQLRRMHGAGWVHRDVKSGNTLFNLKDGEESLTRLIDMGIAERIGNVRIQRGTTKIGTPLYVPTEAWVGRDVDLRMRDYWGAMVAVGEVLGFLKRNQITGGVLPMIEAIGEGRFFNTPNLNDPAEASSYFDGRGIDGAHREFIQWIYDFLQPQTPAVERVKRWREMGITQTLTKQVKMEEGTTKEMTGDFLNDDKFVRELEGHIRGMAKQAGLEVPEETLALLQEFPAAT